MRICNYCQSQVIGKKSGEDETLDYCPTCERIVEGNTKEVNPAHCYFCGKEIKREHSIRIAEHPKDYEGGGIRVWICSDCELKYEED